MSGGGIPKFKHITNAAVVVFLLFPCDFQSGILCLVSSGEIFAPVVFRFKS